MAIAHNVSHPTHTDLFVGGEDGHHTFRIPSVLATAAGTLLGFCEGRKEVEPLW